MLHVLPYVFDTLMKGFSPPGTRMSGVAAARASEGRHLSPPWHPPTWGPLHLPPPHGLVEGRKEIPHLHTRLDAMYVCILTIYT